MTYTSYLENKHSVKLKIMSSYIFYVDCANAYYGEFWYQHSNSKEEEGGITMIWFLNGV